MSPGALDASKALTFTYRNYRGEVRQRRVFPIGFRFGTTEWHPESGWLMLAWDFDKEAKREFAMADVCMLDAPAPAPPAGGGEDDLREGDEVWVRGRIRVLDAVNRENCIVELINEETTVTALRCLSHRYASQAMRDEMIEECARIADRLDVGSTSVRSPYLHGSEVGSQYAAQSIAKAIRALRTDRNPATQEENALKNEALNND